jgi:hypothetical protein
VRSRRKHEKNGETFGEEVDQGGEVGCVGLAELAGWTHAGSSY